MASRQEVSSDGPTAEAWESHREEIKRLYRQENKTIKQVQRFMEEHHDFFATIRMYQIRIHRWDFDKKLKSPEVAYALQRIESRRSMGKDTEIRIRGKPFSEERLRRYVERSKLVPEEDASTPSAVTVRTPPPEVDSPLMNSGPATSASNTPQFSETPLDEESRTARLSGSEPPPTKKRSWTSPPRLRSHLSTPTPTSTLQDASYALPRFVGASALTSSLPNTGLLPRAISSTNLLTHIDHYYKEYFASPCWASWTGNDLYIDELQGFSFPSLSPVFTLGISFRPSWQADPAFVVHCIQSACQLFRSARYRLVRRCLDHANSQIKTLLLEQGPLLLSCLLSAVSLLDFLRAGMPPDTDRPDALRLFLEFVSEMAETKLRSDHPIAQLFSSLVQLRTDHRSVAQAALRRIMEHFRNGAGPQHPCYVRLEYQYAWLLIWQGRFDEARVALEDFLDSVEFRTHYDKPASHASRYLLAQTYIALYRFQEAERCLHMIIEQAKERFGESRAHLLTFEAWRMLAVIADTQERFDARSRWEEEALECGEMAFGPHDPRVMHLQRVISGLEARTAPEKRWHFIWAFPPVEDWKVTP
ncbi:hypothetical protein GJ744_003660 [Endocarpon pusillum]|uniref:Clr5 domain-containing protein n=1 Tax=Endocarpon pusillum TaxID=364733 RepID=A0A8H7A9N2_9EURO|nr:hypothetical protein GJ744_003660 [Endocarpon pusillum]